MNYTLSEIARITGGELVGADLAADRVMTDSRSVVESDNALFVALVGERHDGHAFVPELYRRGVRAFLVERLPGEGKYPDAGFVVTNNTLSALQQLAAKHRDAFRGTVVGITGSNGKTVTKEWIAQLCPPDVRLFRSPRSYNSQLGVPLSLLMLDGGEDIAVIEAGVSHPGEMERLEGMIRPDIGIFTNIGAAHQENFSGTEEKLQEKLGLFRGCRTVICNRDVPGVEQALRAFYPDKELFTVGREGRGVQILPPQGGTARIGFGIAGRVFSPAFPFPDPVSAANASEALALYTVLGYDPANVVPGLEKLQPVAMRLELRDGIAGSKIVNDTYNSDINSLSVALDYLRSVAGKQEKVLILSDIFQTGLSGRELYGEVARLVEKNGIARLVGIGEQISLNRDAFRCEKEFYASTAEFLRRLDKSRFGGKAILIKGSRPFQFERISRQLENKIHTTVLEVNLSAMIHNLNHARSKLKPGVKLMAMVKALSYGSGSYEVAALLQHQRVDYLAVAFADEGVTLREAGITMPIVVLNADADSFGLMVDYRLEPEIYSFSSLRTFTAELHRRGERRYPIHLKLDTGMHRLGFVEDEIDGLIRTLRQEEAVAVHSVFTHFAVSDDPAEDGFTRLQTDRFDRMSARICAAFPERRILRHAANSAAIERFPETQFDMVRLGIGLYGVSFFEPEQLRTVSTLKSKIVQIKHLKAGETVGYGRHGIVTKDTKTATIPIGYADGLDRRLSNGGWSLLVNGKAAPIFGNICMDTCMLDVTGIEVQEGDDAVIFGEKPDVREMAARLGTIPYEIFTSVSTRVKRVYVKE